MSPRHEVQTRRSVQTKQKKKPFFASGFLRHPRLICFLSLPSNYPRAGEEITKFRPATRLLPQLLVFLPLRTRATSLPVALSGCLSGLTSRICGNSNSVSRLRVTSERRGEPTRRSSKCQGAALRRHG